MICESLNAEKWGYRSRCSRTATTMIDGHWLCTQHAKRALRLRVIHLFTGEWFQVAKS